MFSFHEVDSNVTSTATSDIVDQVNYFIDISDNENVAIQPNSDLVDPDTSTRLQSDVSVQEVSADWGLAPEVPVSHGDCVGIPAVSLDWGLAPEVPVAHSDCVGIPEVSFDWGLAPYVPLAHSVSIGVPEMDCSDGGLVPEVSSDGGLAPDVPLVHSVGGAFRKCRVRTGTLFRKVIGWRGSPRCFR
ncbi:hypothetical protein DPMN_102535 [Dreissena polymorpha]|uniref:Uncharacterized protein n=1 Tax=Dreissena polymorpha TaxID=45954 RepID=A0A9D4LKT6_DREPO|nr:hypothetical protein DPMN_102535 [Dreissena polymorpha]